MARGIILMLLRILAFPAVAMAMDGTDFSNMTRRQLINALFGEKSKNDPSIPPDYDKDQPTNVTVQLHIVSFHSVNEVSMEFTMTFYLRRKWMDERLAFPTFTASDVLELDTRLGDLVWIPDIYFRNEKSAVVHNVTVPNRLTHIYKNGTVLLSSRLSMRLSCPMNLLLFPLDIQACPVIIQSYTYSTNNVMFRWAEGRSITLGEDWEMAHFQDHGVDAHACNDEYFDDGFACVMATFRLQRHLGYFLVHVYLPTVLVVILSWISFWIDSGATPARVTIGVMSVLTMTHQGSTVQTVLPRVSYVKAIDVWMAACILFVFGALLEFAYVNVLSRRKDLFYQVHRQAREDSGVPKTTQLTSNLTRKDSSGPKPTQVTCDLVRKDSYVSKSNQETSAQIQKDCTTSVPKLTQLTIAQGVELCPEETLTYRGIDPEVVDKISRWAFPLAFVIFAITYSCVYGALSWQQETRQRRL